MHALKRLHVAATATANGEVLELSAPDGTVYSSLAFQAEGISGDTVSFQGSIDGETYYTLACTPIASTETEATTATADGIWFPTRVAGLRYVRAALTRVSGTVTVTVFAVDV